MASAPCHRSGPGRPMHTHVSAPFVLLFGPVHCPQQHTHTAVHPTAHSFNLRTFSVSVLFCISAPCPSLSLTVSLSLSRLGCGCAQVDGVTSCEGCHRRAVASDASMRRHCRRRCGGAARRGGAGASRSAASPPPLCGFSLTTTNNNPHNTGPKPSTNVSGHVWLPIV